TGPRIGALSLLGQMGVFGLVEPYFGTICEICPPIALSSVIEAIKEHLIEVEKFNATSQGELEAFRIKYLGKKRLLTHFFSEFKSVPNGEKKEFGLMINQLKAAATQKVAQLKELLENQAGPKGKLNDPSRPGEPVEIGARHPIS